MESFGGMSLRHNNDIGQRSHFQWTIVPLPVPLVNFRIVQQRRWRFLSRRNLPQHLCVSHEKSVERLDHLSSHRLASAYLQEAYTLLAPTLRRRVKTMHVQDTTAFEQTEPYAERNIQ